MLDTMKTMLSRDNISRQIPYSIIALILKYEGSLGHDTRRPIPIIAPRMKGM